MKSFKIPLMKCSDECPPPELAASIMQNIIDDYTKLIGTEVPTSDGKVSILQNVELDEEHNLLVGIFSTTDNTLIDILEYSAITTSFSLRGITGEQHSKLYYLRPSVYHKLSTHKPIKTVFVQLSLPDKQLQLYVDATDKYHNLKFINEYNNNGVKEIVGHDWVRPDVVFCSTGLVSRYDNDEAYWKIFNNKIYYIKGNFKYTTYLKELGEHMLNHDAVYIAQVDGSNRHLLTDMWVRPNEDLKPKSFDLGQDIIVATKKNISREMRFFICKCKIVAASTYKIGDKVEWTSEIPEGATEFVEKVTSIYRPHEHFCIDICVNDGEYKVLEFNCINCSCTYAADVEAIIANL